MGGSWRDRCLIRLVEPHPAVVCRAAGERLKLRVSCENQDLEAGTRAKFLSSTERN